MRRLELVEVCGKSAELPLAGFPWQALQPVGWLWYVPPAEVSIREGWHTPHQRIPSWSYLSTP